MSSAPAAANSASHTGGRPDGQPGAVIHTEDLTKVYPGTDFAAVDKLNLDVRAGEIFGLLGPNGAGKTTTAGMLTTRVVPTSGRAFLAGIDVAAHPALAKQLSGIVSQQNTLDRQLTVWENLYFHGRHPSSASHLSRSRNSDGTAHGLALRRDSRLHGGSTGTALAHQALPQARAALQAISGSGGP